MFLIDSHCHLDKLNYKKNNSNPKKILKIAYLKKVKMILLVSTSLKNFKKIKKKFKKKFNNILYSCGIHPLNIKNIKDFYKIKKFCSKKMVSAIGETGLDYYYGQKSNILQKKIFRKHIRLGIKLNKPIIVHSRSAEKDTIKILQQENSEICGGILHSFNQNLNMLRNLLNLNFYISISGIITFKNSENLRKIIKFIPLNKLLIETDSPYLTPEPYRGKENNPSHINDIITFISKIIKIKKKKLSKIIKKNFFNLFKLKKIKKTYFI
ncbi:YchF/TatD family DNA exonuclease [Buchnera aphidicola]|uniref:YchF/TatD family DNA exonuclease n=1 Tax=Buchnera aphidicola TaxID=9 RepID=UPI0030ED6164